MTILVRGFEVAVKFMCTCRKCGLSVPEERSHTIRKTNVYMRPLDVQCWLNGLRPVSLDIPVGWSSNGVDAKGQILWCNNCTGA